MTTTPWAHLPNAVHIDAVLADVKARPDVWAAAWCAVPDEPLSVALNEVWSVGRDASWSIPRNKAWCAVLGKTLELEHSAAHHAACSVILALATWDSSADLLDHPSDVLRAMIALSDAPVCHQAVLLLPYAIVRSNDTNTTMLC